MAIPVLDFSASVAPRQDGKITVVLEDKTDYTDSTVPSTSRSWIITDTVSKQVIKNTAENPVSITVDKDSALVIKLALVYNEITEGSTVSKTKNVLVSTNLSSSIYSMRKLLMEHFMTAGSEPKIRKLLDIIDICEAFELGALALLSTDIAGAQRALDLGNYQAKKASK